MTVNNKESHSVPHNKQGTSVNASPYNHVKFDLGIILILAVFVLVVVSAAEPRFFGQILYLAGFGLVSMVWLVVKIRRVTRSLEIDATGSNGEI